MFNDREDSDVRLEATDALSDMSDAGAGQPSEKAATAPRNALGVGRRAGSRSKGASATRKPGRTLGQVIRNARQELHFTQRELAEKLGVKPAHIAYLELDRRRPSLPLLARIAEILGLDREMLISLSYPEAKPFIGTHKEPAPAKPKDHVWKQFTGDRRLLNQHQVTGNELKVLRQVNLLGKISAPRNFLFILNSIRQAQDEEDSK